MSDQSALVFEVSKSSFNTSVILNSHKLPVLVEFLGSWSAPCIEMEEHLARLATEFAGQFVFAKVDIDEQQELMKDYAVENVPTLKVFKDGEVVRTEEGQLQEKELRELLRNLGVYRQSDDQRELARQKHMQGETMEAITLLTQAIKQDPSNTRVAMDMVQIFIDIDQLEQAKSLFNRLPEKERVSEAGKILLGQLTFRDLASKTAGKEALQQRLLQDSDDYDALFDLAVCFVAENDFIQAMDKLFLLFEANPEYKDGAAKEMIISLTNMISANEPGLAQEFRRRLGATLS